MPPLTEFLVILDSDSRRSPFTSFRSSAVGYVLSALPKISVPVIL